MVSERQSHKGGTLRFYPLQDGIQGLTPPFPNVSSFPPPPRLLSELLSHEHTGVGGSVALEEDLGSFSTAHFLMEQKPTISRVTGSRTSVDVPGSCSGSGKQGQEGADGNGPGAAQFSRPRTSRLPFSPTTLPDLTPKPSQLCKLLPSFMQSFGQSPKIWG